MDKQTLALARQDWAWSNTDNIIVWPADRPEAGDNLIAMAVDCRRQTRQQIAPLTEEDARILARRVKDGYVVNGLVNWCANDWAGLRYLVNLNA